MRNVKVERTVAAPRAAVWAVLADYPNISEWNDGVNHSYSLGDATEGVGAQRKCELDRGVTMRETVTEWEPRQRLVVVIDELERMPVKRAQMTFTLAEGGETTPLTMSYAYEPKGGPLGFIVAALLGGQMEMGFNGFVDDLERAAQAQPAA